jgi:hypothetical protein
MKLDSRTFHIECFCCHVCNKKLQIGEHFFIRDNLIYCQEDSLKSYMFNNNSASASTPTTAPTGPSLPNNNYPFLNQQQQQQQQHSQQQLYLPNLSGYTTSSSSSSSSMSITPEHSISSFSPNTGSSSSSSNTSGSVESPTTNSTQIPLSTSAPNSVLINASLNGLVHSNASLHGRFASNGLNGKHPGASATSDAVSGISRAALDHTNKSSVKINSSSSSSSYTEYQDYQDKEGIKQEKHWHIFFYSTQASGAHFRNGFMALWLYFFLSFISCVSLLILRQVSLTACA